MTGSADRDLGRLVMELKETVLDYNPSTDLLKRVIVPPKVVRAGVAFLGVRNNI